MKKYISLVITAIFCLNIALATGITANAMEYGLFEGYGTQKHPFLIKTADDVMAENTLENPNLVDVIKTTQTGTEGSITYTLAPTSVTGFKILCPFPLPSP